MILTTRRWDTNHAHHKPFPQHDKTFIRNTDALRKQSFRYLSLFFCSWAVLLIMKKKMKKIETILIINVIWCVPHLFWRVHFPQQKKFRLVVLVSSYSLYPPLPPRLPLPSPASPPPTSPPSPRSPTHYRPQTPSSQTVFRVNLPL